MVKWLHLLSGFGLAVTAFATASAALAFGQNPTPYDSENFVPNTLVERSSSQYFVLDAALPAEWQGALDQRQWIGVTGFFVGGISNGGSAPALTINTQDMTLLQQPEHVCSQYDKAMCFNVGDFYTPHMPQAGVTGIFALDGSTMLQWGVNTGFDSAKLTVSPAIMLGLAKRFYLTEDRASHIVFEASEWIGGAVKHRPCLDNFDRQYFCGTVSAWSDFSYDSRPRSGFLKLTYEALF